MNQIKDIVKAGLCIGCGVCVSDSEGSLKMELNEDGFYTPKQVFEKETNAALVCPFNPHPDKEVEDEDKIAELFLKDAPKIDSKIGHYFNIYVGYSSKYRETSSSGGIGTYILEQLLDQKIVDHLFVVGESNGRYGYQWVEESSQIRKISKTRYYPVHMEKLFEEIDQKQGKIAVSGIPAFLKAIRLKQYYHPEYREKIAFLVGIICGGWKSTFFTDYLAQKAGIHDKFHNPEYRIKDENSLAINYSFGAYDSDNDLHQIRMKEVGDMWGTGMFNSNASDFGDDVTAELADISLGDAWINPYMQDGRGTSLFVTRSLIAEKLIKDGIKNNQLDLDYLSLDKFISSQAGAFRHRQLGLKYRLKKLRKEKGIIPHKRKRILQNIPFEYKLVQKDRMILRAKSLELWKKSKDCEKFDQEIEVYKKRLAKSTRWYHRIQKLKRKLGLKTIM